jgi:hypothetical protein
LDSRFWIAGSHDRSRVAVCASVLIENQESKIENP